MSEGKTKKSKFIRSNQLCAAVLVFISIQQYPISHKTEPSFKIKTVDTVTLKHSKKLMHVKRAYIFNSELNYQLAFRVDMKSYPV